MAGPDELRAALARNHREASDLAARVGQDRLRRILKRAEEELAERLHAAEGLKGAGAGSFTAQQLRVTLAQVRETTRTVLGGLKGVMLQQAGEAADAAAGNLVDYLGEAEKAFRGVGAMPLQIREAGILDAAREGSRASILRRLSGEGSEGVKAGILRRYGAEVLGHFEDELQQGLVQRKPWAEVRAALVKRSPFLQQAPAHWAERIVRTETAGAYNRAGWEGVREADQQLGDMVKILSSAMDDRTGSDSIAVHGQIRRPEEAFSTWFGFVQHPPDRPNDRAIVVPHRVSWPIPPYLAWRDEGEVVARWHLEKRKGAPPPRPIMTTVPLASFGKEQKKPQAAPPAAQPGEEKPRGAPPREGEEPREDEAGEAAPREEAAPEEAKAGVHFRKYYRPLDMKDKEWDLRIGRIKAGMAKSGLLSYLEKVPIDVVTVKPPKRAHGEYVRSTTMNVNAMGAVTVASRTFSMSIDGKRRAGTFGQPFVPGKVHNISQSGMTPEDAVHRTVVHELGHHLHFHDGDVAVDAVVRGAYWKTRGSKEHTPITKYAGTNHKEYFSESFAAYRYHPEELRTHDPVGHAMVEEVLKMRGQK